MGIFDFLIRRRRPTSARAVAPPGADLFAARLAQRELLWRRWLENVKHPYELVPGTQAQVALEATRALGKREGFSPLVILPGYLCGVSTEPMSLKDSKVCMASEYFEWRARAFANDTDGLALFDDVNEVTRPTDGSNQLYVMDLLSETRQAAPYAEVAILRLPCAESWKIPLFASTGVPLDQSHMTTGEEIGIEKNWYERFGAELCCLGRRSWQFSVARPPRDHREAVALLREHYLYAWQDNTYDREMIENSAAWLRTATYWQFFWM